MKPPKFRYVAPTRLEEALAILAEEGDEGRILAGGQSLLPALNMRLERPAVVVDINRLPGLERCEVEGDRLVVGALARHRALESPPLGGPVGGLLARAAHLVAHPPVRARGTMLGSLAFADPAAEWPLVATLLDAELTAASARTTRTLPAAELFAGPGRTTLGPDEMLVEASFPVLEGGRAAIVEESRTKGDWAVVAAACYVGPPGPHRDVRVAVGGASGAPVRLRRLEAEVAARGAPDAGEVRDLIDDALDPPDDLFGSARYRRHLAAVLARRALLEAAA